MPQQRKGPRRLLTRVGEKQTCTCVPYSLTKKKVSRGREGQGDRHREKGKWPTLDSESVPEGRKERSLANDSQLC